MIIIIGDSWGCGEWMSAQGPNEDQYRVTHHGLEQYLIDDGYSVTNLSRGSFQNDEVIERFENYLNNNPAPTQVFWFVTCVLRTPVLQIDNPYDFGIDKLKKEFEYINQLTNKFDTKVYAIGGLCDLPEELIQIKFSNLSILIPSVSSLVLENYPQSLFGDARELFRIKSKQSALDVAELIEQKYNIFKQSSFFPDFGHPDRRVHKLIFEKIKPYV